MVENLSIRTVRRRCGVSAISTDLLTYFLQLMLCSDVTLRMLIDDRYCGRIIGREGKTVKKIREDTGTRISVSKYDSIT